MFFNILIVDDEEHVIDALRSLLELQPDIDCEVFSAQTAELALKIIEKERIDLLISDIRLPGMDGLSLVDIVSKQWPLCQSIMLTGYSDFDSVYRAMQLKTAGFLLKTENDQQILRKVHEVLQGIEARLNQTAILQTSHGNYADERLGQAVSALPEQRRDILQQIGVDPLGSMILCLCTVGPSSSSALDAFIRYFMQGRFPVIRCWCLPNQRQTLWLFQDSEPDVSLSIVSTLMEMVQNSYCATCATEFSCMIAAANVDNIDGIFQQLTNALEEPSANMRSVTIITPLGMQQKNAEYLIRYLQKYITEHIAQDVSIPTLARETGYNADYLSRIFRNYAGSTLGQYIANVRLSVIRDMMRNSKNSFDDIAQQVGFCNRSSFNRFVKRCIGMTPREWYHHLQESNQLDR